jgi:hypothetical protein
MGTNYYLETPETEPCAHCGRADKTERLHIGKSSGGWCFSLHVIPEEGINDLPDWESRWQNGTIKDEYGDTLSPLGMLDVITARGWKERPDPLPQIWYDQNHAEPGPNGLSRHRIGKHCVSHGAGTWDCITGEFS